MGRSVEDAIQVELVRVARDRGLFVFHVPNGGTRTAREGAQFKRMGVQAGIPDLVFVLPKGEHVYVELKRAKGKLSSAQTLVHKQLQDLGAEVFTAYGLEQGLRIIDYLVELQNGNPNNRGFNERHS